jgi:hypothetical protein
MDDIHVIKTSIENLSLEIEASKVFESNDEIFILNFLKLHAQRLFWKLEERNVICWAFYVVNHNKLVDGKIPQVMRCHSCYKTHVLYNPRTKLRKGLISYYKTNGISTLKKHVDVEHNLLAKKLNEEVNSLMRSQVEKQLVKKRQNVSSYEISEFFFAKLFYKKDEVQ